MIDKDVIISFLLQKSITSKSPERKFGNELIDHSNKEDECASDVRNTKTPVIQYHTTSHTLIEGYLFRFDRNKYEGGIILYVREDIPVKVLCHGFLFADGFFVKINLHKRRWIILSNKNKNNIITRIISNI